MKGTKKKKYGTKISMYNEMKNDGIRKPTWSKRGPRTKIASGLHQKKTNKTICPLARSATQGGKERRGETRGGEEVSGSFFLIEKCVVDRSKDSLLCFVKHRWLWLGHVNGGKPYLPFGRQFYQTTLEAIRTSSHWFKCVVNVCRKRVS